MDLFSHVNFCPTSWNYSLLRPRMPRVNPPHAQHHLPRPVRDRVLRPHQTHQAWRTRSRSLHIGGGSRLITVSPLDTYLRAELARPSFYGPRRGPEVLGRRMSACQFARCDPDPDTSLVHVTSTATRQCDDRAGPFYPRRRGPGNTSQHIRQVAIVLVDLTVHSRRSERCVEPGACRCGWAWSVCMDLLLFLETFLCTQSLLYLSGC
ncbi:hypothetical protein C8R46DRAFT_1344360 [Mycena filopes]|nr:hypothetical protein C8R46DRAFT_1344360 [Mycena filopes]